MRDDPTPKALELGLYAQDVGAPRITWIEILAAVLTVVWIAVVALVNFGGAEDSGGIAFGLMGVLGIIMPIALIWVAVSAARRPSRLRRACKRREARSTRQCRPAARAW